MQVASGSATHDATAAEPTTLVGNSIDPPRKNQQTS